jgi:TP901 family phage tail tape measure protein
MAKKSSNNIDIDVNAHDNVTLPLRAIESGIIRFVGAITASIVAFRAASFQITSAADLQEELINVQKTTEFTDATIQQLGSSLRVLSRQVNVTATDLAKIAAVGGQLGLGNQGSEALLAFTDSASRMSSVLDVSVENAANGIAKITNIFKIGLKDAESIVSGFNELSNNSTASGEDLLDVVQRIGDASVGLDLSESLGLAATGVDLGLTLETIGTSFSKVFLDLQTKSSQLAQLMGTTAEKWADHVQDKPVQALKDYLAVLRTLGNVDRARVSEQITGGGRIAALINKLTQDTNNTILDKNIGFADSGIVSGLSAIKEQQTVLQGFNAQLQITGNHFTALASEVGERALPVVTTLLRRFQEWADSPEVLDGVIRISEAVGGAALAFVDLVRFVADLNVNWDNMVKIGAAWIALNMARSMTTWLGTLGAVRAAISAIDGTGMKAFATRLQTISNSAKATATHIAGLAASASTVILGAASRPFIPATNTVAQNANTAQSSAAVAAAKAHSAALKEQMAAYLGLQEIQANSLVLAAAREAKETATTAKITALGQQTAAEFALNDQKRIVGTQKTLAAGIRANALLAANAKETNAIIAASHARTAALAVATTPAQITSANASYAARVGVAKKAARDEIALAESVYTARRTILAADLNATRIHYAERVAIARAAAEAEVAAIAALTAASTAQVLTSGAILVAGLKKIMAGLMRLFSLGLWGALIFTILDMTGLLGPLANAWQKVTDAVGLTSEAMRKHDQQQRIRDKKLEDETKRLAALRDEYINLALAQGGLDPEVFGVKVKQADGRRKETAEASVEAVNKFAVSKLAGEQSKGIKESFDAENADLSVRYKKLSEEIAKARKGVAELDKEIASMEQIGDAFGLGQARDQLQKDKDALTALLQDMTEAQSQIEQRQGAAAARVIGSFDEIQEAAEDFVPALKQIFTSEMAALVESAVLPAVVAKKQLSELKTQIEDLGRAMSAAKDGGLVKTKGPDGTDVEVSLAAARAQMVVLENAALAATSKIQQANTALSKLGDTNQKDASRDTLLGMINAMDPGKVEAVLVILRRLRDENALVGTITLGATKGPEAADGTANISGSDLALARLRTEKEILDARVRLLRETINQELDEYGDGYSRGLVALEDYYQGRKVLIEEGLKGEIKLRQQELVEATHAFNTAGQNNPNDRAAQQESARAAQARIRGDIAVLEKRLGAVAGEVDRDRVADIKDRNREILDLEIQLAEETGDVQRAQLLRTDLEHEELMTRLQTERRRLNGETAAAALADDTARLQKLAEETAKLDRTIAIVIELKSLGRVEAEVDEFISRTSAKLRLGLSAPTEVGALVLTQMAKSGPELEQRLESIRAELAATQDEAQRAVLEKKLALASEAAVELQNDLIELHRTAISAFGNEIDIKLRLGLIDIADASEQVAAFARDTAQSLVGPINELQEKIASGAGTPEQLAQWSSRLNFLNLQYLDLTNTISDLAGTINEELSGAFSDFLWNAASDIENIGDAFRNLGLQIAETLGRMASEQLVEKAFGGLLKGTGSIGDVLSKFMAGKDAATANTAATAAANSLVSGGPGVPGLQRGGTPLTPMYVQDVAAAGGLAPSLGGALGGQIAGPGGAAGDPSTGFFAGVMQSFTNLGEGIRNIFSGKAGIMEVIQQFGTDVFKVFGTAFDNLRQLFSTATGDGGDSGFIDGLLSIFSPDSGAKAAEVAAQQVSAISTITTAATAADTVRATSAVAATGTVAAAQVPAAATTTAAWTPAATAASVGSFGSAAAIGVAALIAAFLLAKSFAGSFAEGGVIRGAGTGTSDSIIARVSHGEHITRATQTRKWLPLLSAINAGVLDDWLPTLRMPSMPAFADGGLVTQTAPAQPQSGGAGVRIINVIDPKMAADYLTSSAGEKTILNILRRNAGAVRQTLG